VSLDTSIESVMSKGFDTVEADAFAVKAVDLISQHSDGCLVVVAGGNAVGIVTEDDIVTKITANRVDPSKVYVRDIMSTPVITISEDSTVERAAETMTQYKINRLVVVERSGAVAGLITSEDLASCISKRGSRDQLTTESKGTEPLGPYR
jgi:CBS domain-containing protein